MPVGGEDGADGSGEDGVGVDGITGEDGTMEDGTMEGGTMEGGDGMTMTTIMAARSIGAPSTSPCTHPPAGMPASAG